jgi:hypothetical protein
MHSKIQTRPTVRERPNDHCQRKQTAPNHPTKEYGYAERIGSMSREETVFTTSIAINDIH